jgi:hypothetical protein
VEAPISTIGARHVDLLSILLLPGAITFTVIIDIAAYWDCAIRVLHVFESLPHMAAAVLCLRHTKLETRSGTLLRLLAFDN